MNRVNADRRRLMQLSLLTALPSLIASSAVAEPTAKPAASGAGSEHEFDFFFGSWQVRTRRLKKRLAQNNEWEEYDGSTKCQAILGGIANLNDSVVNRSTGIYRGMGLRTFDAKTNTWTDYYLDSRDPTKIDVHGTGRFVHGVATFLSDDTFDGKPIQVRGLWSNITSHSFQWEQAFSPDGGKTWETNLINRYTRMA